MSARPQPPPIIGVSTAIRRARELVQRYAPTPLSVLLVGATGSGKELLAQHVHFLSGRPGPLVDMNCAALPRDLAESLLFGHTRGAYTGAHSATRGYILRSDRGTLFLDEIDSLRLELQGKLLRVVETHEIEPLDGEVRRVVDLRLVAAASETLNRAMDEGRLRRDLFQRLAGVVIALPPLIDRMEDVLPLARHFAALRGQHLEPKAEAVLRNYSWPGNVRELRLTVERACTLVPNGCLSATALAEAIELGTVPTPRNGDGHAEVSRKQLVSTLATYQWSAACAAGALGIHRATLFRRLKRYGLSIRTLRKSH